MLISFEVHIFFGCKKYTNLEVIRSNLSVYVDVNTFFMGVLLYKNDFVLVTEKVLKNITS